MPWDNKTTAKLLKFAAEGLTAGQIANRLGVSRSTVCGKAWRMGLHLGSAGSTLQAMQVNGRIWARNYNGRRAKESGNTAPKPVKHFGARAKLQPEPYSIRTDVPPAVARKTLAHLEDGDCRWPVGDPREPDFGFCANPKIPGLPYCKDCAQRAFNNFDVQKYTPQPEEVFA